MGSEVKGQINNPLHLISLISQAEGIWSMYVRLAEETAFSFSSYCYSDWVSQHFGYDACSNVFRLCLNCPRLSSVINPWHLLVSWKTSEMRSRIWSWKHHHICFVMVKNNLTTILRLEQSTGAFDQVIFHGRFSWLKMFTVLFLGTLRTFWLKKVESKSSFWTVKMVFDETISLQGPFTSCSGAIHCFPQWRWLGQMTKQQHHKERKLVRYN